MNLNDELMKIAGKIPVSTSVMKNLFGQVELALGQHAAGEIGKARKSLSGAKAFGQANLPRNLADMALTRGQKSLANTARDGVRDYTAAFPEVMDIVRSVGVK